MGSGKVYVVHNDWIKDPINGKMPYKIGKTTADSVVDGRFHGIGLIMPGKFVCDFAYEFDGEQQYSKVESALHDLLDDSKVNGEWYWVNDKVLSGIRTACELAGGRPITEEVTTGFAGKKPNGPVTHNTCTRDGWIEKSKWTVETADYLKDLISGAGVIEKPDFKYNINNIAIVSSNVSWPFNVYFIVEKRSGKSSSLLFSVKEKKRNELKIFLDGNNIQCRLPGREDVRISIDKQFVEQHKDVFIKIAEYVKDFKER